MKFILEMCRVHYIRPVYFYLCSLLCVKINVQLIAVRKHLYVHSVVIWYRESIYYNQINCLVDLISVLLSLITKMKMPFMFLQQNEIYKIISLNCGDVHMFFNILSI